MTEIETIIHEIRELKNVLGSNQTDYCDTEEASRILAVPSRHLKKLHEEFGLPRYPRVKSFVYKKTDCYRYAAMLDNKTIML